MKLLPLLLLGSALAHADVTLVHDHQSPLTIYTTAKPAFLEKTAASELAKYLEKLSGTAFVVKPLPEPAPEAGIFIGGPADPALAPDDFKIEARGQTIRLTGGSPLAAEWAAFALLEDHLGCRWWTHDEEDLPAPRATLTIPEFNRVTKPALEIHNVWNREAQNPHNQFAAKARTTSTTSFSGGHTLYPLLKEYGSTHPEIYPLNKDGVRKPNDLHFCYSTPGLAEALADAIGKQVDAQKTDPRKTIYFAGMGDWYGGMCECDRCKAIYEEEAWTDPDGRTKNGVTGTLLRMINQTAELLDQRYPGIRIGTFAYMSLEAPPAKTVPRENVVIRVPRLRHCGVHPARSCEKDASFARNLERWCQIAPGRVYVWEYGIDFTQFLNPFPCLYSMADNIKYYHELGVRGVEIQGNYVSTGGDMAAVKNYVWRKIFWQPERDPRELLAEFCHGYYGPAADDMMAYTDALENSVRQPELIHADEFAPPSYLRPLVRAAMEKARDEALAHAEGNETFQRRIRETTVGLESTLLWKPGPLEEVAGQLVRTDLQGDPPQRARDMLKYLRGAGPNEYQVGPSAQLAMLTYQGGPLYTLEGGGLNVKVAPSLNGRIRQITWRGKPLLHVETNTKLKGYPQLGGSADGANTRIMSIEGEPTAAQLRMTGLGGFGPYGGTAGLTVGKTVELATNNTIVETMDVKHITKAAKGEQKAAVATSYAYGKKVTKASVEYLTEDEQWHSLALTGEQAEWPLPKLTALRIHLPEQACTVIDRYLFPETTGGKIAINPVAGTLTTIVNTTPVEVVQGPAVRFLERRVEVQDQP